MAHENKNNEAPGNKASDIKKNVVELNENDLSKVAGGGGSLSLSADEAGRSQDGIDKFGGGKKDPADDITIADDDGTVIADDGTM